MPEMDGFELCSLIKSNVEYSHTPIILLTAKNSIQSKVQGTGTGRRCIYRKAIFKGAFIGADRQFAGEPEHDTRLFLPAPHFFNMLNYCIMQRGQKTFISSLYGQYCLYEPVGCWQNNRGSYSGSPTNWRSGPINVLLKKAFLYMHRRPALTPVL